MKTLPSSDLGIAVAIPVSPEYSHNTQDAMKKQHSRGNKAADGFAHLPVAVTSGTHQLWAVVTPLGGCQHRQKAGLPEGNAHPPQK